MPASRSKHEHAMDYQGRERRRRFVYVTRNTEYHVMDRVCVGVRDRQSGDWQHRHLAVQRRLEGGARVLGNGAIVPSLDGPAVGHSIYFVVEDIEEMREIVTSRLEAIARPEIEDLMRYPAASCSFRDPISRRRRRDLRWPRVDCWHRNRAILRRSLQRRSNRSDRR